MKLDEIKEKPPAKFCLVDINVDYENMNGRDVNKDFVIAVDCGTEEKAQELHAQIQSMDDIGFKEGASGIDADDVVNSSAYSYSITPGKGPTAAPPKKAYQVGLDQFKITDRG